jgi:hypothetical protein
MADCESREEAAARRIVARRLLQLRHHYFRCPLPHQACPPAAVAPELKATGQVQAHTVGQPTPLSLAASLSRRPTANNTHRSQTIPGKRGSGQAPCKILACAGVCAASPGCAPKAGTQIAALNPVVAGQAGCHPSPPASAEPDRARSGYVALPALWLWGCNLQPAPFECRDRSETRVRARSFSSPPRSCHTRCTRLSYSHHPKHKALLCVATLRWGIHWYSSIFLATGNLLVTANLHHHTLSNLHGN